MKKTDSGFSLIEVVVGIVMIGLALGMVGVARQKKETVKRQVQTNIEQAAQERSKIEEATKAAPPELPDAEKRDQEKAKGKRPQARSSGEDSGSFDVSQCFPGSPDPSCMAIFGDSGAGSWYEQQQQEAQQQLYEQYYYYEQQQQQMFDPNQFMQNPYQQFNPALEGLYPQFFPGF